MKAAIDQTRRTEEEFLFPLVEDELENIVGGTIPPKPPFSSKMSLDEARRRLEIYQNATSLALKNLGKVISSLGKH